MQRIGFGYDSHRFTTSKPLVLGGVRIEYEQGLAGHSDADAVLHAITDAILGAMGLDDIGEQFSDTDPQWQNADSAVFVCKAVELVNGKGFRVGNCDVTVLAQQPKLATYKQKMKMRIAELLGIEIADVAVKAKTNENMGFIGRSEGIAAMVIVMLIDD